MLAFRTKTSCSADWSLSRSENSRSASLATWLEEDEFRSGLWFELEPVIELPQEV